MTYTQELRLKLLKARVEIAANQLVMFIEQNYEITFPKWVKGIPGYVIYSGSKLTPELIKGYPEWGEPFYRS